MRSRRVFASLAAVGLWLAGGTVRAPAQAAGSPGAGSQTAQPASNEPAGLEVVKHCTIVGAGDASALLGFDVQPADASTQSAGICTFPSQSLTREGVVAYSVVTTADVVARATYFRFLAVRCANVDPRAPNAAQCATFRKLAVSTTAAEYYAARTATPDAAPLAGLGDAAASNATAVYVVRGDEVFECAVRRSEVLDVDRSTALASLLLSRVAPIAASPSPAASKTP